ncbi:butyrophilin subfamily 1 member A1-like [Pleurodeles waltl]|uniref:butyrophilin subfamily 1 member A1-like n=1 Tax=Pleurodeles waltl TaxID=8319 RepID=UPI0037096C49
MIRPGGVLLMDAAADSSATDRPQLEDPLQAGTWLNLASAPDITIPAGYGIKYHINKPGRGITIIHRDSIKCTTAMHNSIAAMKKINFTIQMDEKTTISGTPTYHPPGPLTTFCKLITDLITTLTIVSKDYVFLGDLNFSLEDIIDLMVTLDPDTAHPQLLLSEGGRRVRWTDTAQPVPEIPKRFTSWCVLGRQGFTSGRHYWEVQLLQERTAWNVGVAAESVNRKEKITWSPEGGVWAVERGWNDQYWALTSPLTPLSPREGPRKLGVYLDYEGGRLSLYNADSMELLFTFPRAHFTHRLFPILNLWGEAEMRLV